METLWNSPLVGGAGPAVGEALAAMLDTAGVVHAAPLERDAPLAADVDADRCSSEHSVLAST